MDASSMRALLRAVAHSLFMQIYQQERTLLPSKEVVRDNGFRVVVEIAEDHPVSLREADTRLLEAASSTEYRSVKTLARKVGIDVTYARKRIARMLRLKLMERGPGGVRKLES
jgi:hypothetical protein